MGFAIFLVVCIGLILITDTLGPRGPDHSTTRGG